MRFEVGSIVRFDGYKYRLPGVPEIFSSGDALTVVGEDADGAARYALADFDGLPIMEITDTLFDEELQPEIEAEAIM